MLTNMASSLTESLVQRKATNFYSSTNVKNKNRTKASLLRSLQKTAGKERKRRR